MLRRLKEGRAENVAVCGLRGAGKTVLLRRFSRMCGSEGFLPVICRLYSPSHREPAAFMETFRHGVGVATAAINGAGVPGSAARGPRLDRRGSAPLDAEVESCVRHSLEMAQKSGIAGIVAMMDEFHAVRDVESKNWRVAGSLIGAFNVLQQEGLPASLVLCGLPSVAPNAVSARSYSERMFGYMEVSSLSAGEAKSAIFEPLGRTDRSFSDETADAVVRDTGGHPYFIQCNCSRRLGPFTRTAAAPSRSPGPGSSRWRCT